MSLDSTNQQIIEAVQAQPELAGLTATSRVSVWRSLVYRVAAAWQSVEESLNALSEQVRESVRRSSSRTAAWHVARALEYQPGDALIIVNNEPQYAVLDPTNRLITRAFVNETGEVPVLHVSKGSTDNPEALTALELAEFRAYANDRIRGTRKLAYRSTAGDEARISCQIYYYPDGGDKAAEVQAAINAYLLNGLGANGKVNRNLVEAAARRVPNVFDVVLTRYQFKPAGSTGWQEGGNIYQLQSGYARLTDFEAETNPISYT